ncbi:hypothetical protein EE612_057252, partial [Oryza sativa]
DLLSLGR